MGISSRALRKPVLHGAITRSRKSSRGNLVLNARSRVTRLLCMYIFMRMRSMQCIPIYTYLYIECTSSFREIVRVYSRREKVCWFCSIATVYISVYINAQYTPPSFYYTAAYDYRGCVFCPRACDYIFSRSAGFSIRVAKHIIYVRARFL